MPDNLSVSAQSFANDLENVKGHIQVANDWAERHLELFPHLSSVSITLGASLCLEFNVTLTWIRKGEER